MEISVVIPVYNEEGNLASLFKRLCKSMDEIEREFSGVGYGDFKLAVGETCADALSGVQNEFARLSADKAYLESIMKEGAEAAAYMARRTMSKVYRKIGFYSGE